MEISGSIIFNRKKEEAEKNMATVDQNIYFQLKRVSGFRVISFLDGVIYMAKQQKQEENNILLLSQTSP